MRTLGWTAISSYGGVYGQIIKTGRFIIFGTDYTKLFVVNTKNSKDIRTKDLNIGTVIPQVVRGNYVYAISGDSYWKINFKNFKTVWSFTTEGQFDVERGDLRGDRVYLSSRDGSFYVLNEKNGAIIWKLAGTKLDQISSRVVDGAVYHAPDFWLVDDLVYLASRDGNLYSIKAKDGEIVWKQEINEPLVGNFTIYKNQIFVFTKNGSVIAVDRKTGRVNWQSRDNSSAICSEINNSNLFMITEEGKFVSRNVKNGNIIWESLPLGKGVNCPYHVSKDGIFTSTAGGVFRVDVRTGEIKWTKSGFGIITSAPLVVTRGLTKNYIFTNLAGEVFSIDSNHQTIWKFDAKNPIHAGMLIDKANIFVGTSNGTVYKINKFTGRPNIFTPFFKFNVQVSSKMIGNNEIFEINLLSSSEFINPWAEAELTGEFTSESGKTINVNGFYYDDSIWKLRFNPPEKGLWNYELQWFDHGVLYKRKGQLMAKTDTTESFLRVDKSNPKRLTLDGKTIFNGVGIQELILDFNRNGTPLDDWSTGISDEFISTSSAGTRFHVRSNIPITLSEYINTYGPNGAGINIYRFSVMNGNAALYRDFLRPPVYSIHDGKIADELLGNLKQNGVHVWLTLFHFSIPFENTLTPSEKDLLRSYVKYVVARFGAYVDIWELVNELDASSQVKDFLIEEINKLDFENRPVSISTPDTTEDPGYVGIDIISPHWYQTENVTESDDLTVRFIDRYKNYPKPVVFGEQGNGSVNWDVNSALRMRIRLWTAFFKEGILIFWSDSNRKGIPQNKPFYANIYLGDEERAYIRNLQNFTGSFPLLSKPISFPLEKYGVRGYGLVSDSKVAGYFYHYSSPFSDTRFTLTVPSGDGGEVKWVDPETGKIIQESACPPVKCNLASPLFKTDISLIVE
jgi:outer membrane protein assembly factor BamB